METMAGVRALCRTVAALGIALLAGAAPAANAEGDAGVGKGLYERTCLGCHGDAYRAPTTGPSLVDIIGRKAGADASGVISRASAESGIVWNETNLDEYLASPSEKVHGTLMPIGVREPRDRANLIAYLKTLRK
jgi:cytochrome c